MNQIGVVINITLTKCRITSADPPDIMFVKFFDEKYTPAMNDT